MGTEQKIDTILAKLTVLDEIKADINETKTQISTFSLAIQKNTMDIECIKADIESQNQTIYNIEKTIKRRNLIFVGIEETEKSKTELEKSIIDIIKKYTNITLTSKEIEICFRLGRKANKIRPILVTFTSIKTRDEIFSKRTQLKGSNIFINEDLSRLEREKYKELVNQMKNLKDEGRKVKIYRNKICFSDEDKADHKRGRQSSDDTPEKSSQKPKVSKLSQSNIDTFFDAHQNQQSRL